jgi:hypothetical protein
MTLFRVSIAAVALATTAVATSTPPQTYRNPEGKIRVALAKQPLSPNGPSRGPTTMAEGGIQEASPPFRPPIRAGYRSRP